MSTSVHFLEKCRHRFRAEAFASDLGRLLLEKAPPTLKRWFAGLPSPPPTTPPASSPKTSICIIIIIVIIMFISFVVFLFMILIMMMMMIITILEIIITSRPICHVSFSPRLEPPSRRGGRDSSEPSRLPLVVSLLASRVSGSRFRAIPSLTRSRLIAQVWRSISRERDDATGSEPSNRAIPMRKSTPVVLCPYLCTSDDVLPVP